MSLTLTKPIHHFPLFTPPNHHHNHHHHHHNNHRPTTIIRLSQWNNPNFQKHNHHKLTQKKLEDHLRLHKRFQSANNIITTTTTTTTPPPYKSTGTPSSPSLPSIPGKKSKYSKPHHNIQYPYPQKFIKDSRFIKVRNFPQDIHQQTQDNQESEELGSTFIKASNFHQEIHQQTYEIQENCSTFIKDPNFAQEMHQESQQSEESGSRFIKDSSFSQQIHQENQETEEIGSRLIKDSNFSQESGSRFIKDRNFPNSSQNPYSKTPYLKNPDTKNHNSHPAFKKTVRVRNIPKEIEDEGSETGIKVTDKGVMYVIPEAPFEFQYSYTETPKVKPVRLREAPMLPFGPGTRGRPWTGKKPLPKGKKVEFDSFVLPPVGKKGVKPVQAPGPFLAGAGPKYVKEREEVLGEPLSKEEVDALVKGCLKSSRQLNIGRDGLTHNMLDNIHAHWKRRRVCKIKCKGVCTVDMDNVRHQLEEKTGGKVIYSKGGVVYLFRGRNYNYKTRPVFPLMLWKPVTPVYPRLIQRVPEGLTLEEASEMRRKGRQLNPICKLGKNGVYCDLVNNVREAFEACDLVRINCEGMNGSDYRKIGAKLKDLVPCVLISFEHEHILVWRGHNWKSMFTDEDKPREANFPVTEAEQNETIVSTPDNIDDNESVFDADESVIDNESMFDDEESVTDDKSITDDESMFDDDESITHVDIENNISENASKQDSLPGVMSLLKQAVQDGIAYILEDSHMDADEVYAKAVAFSKSAQPGPTFRLQRPKKVVATSTEKQEDEETVENEVVTVSAPKKGGKGKNPRTRKKDSKENYLDIAPQPTLRVDELAKLLG